ncbi:4-hydroxy-tetrahydrodipicolinate synthase [Proteiniclasticum sp. C24MP]|uniref:4-hydroxy-tetrahydrodipicolinate synthase n=1 Tax=Proteiniclasticum sp. C24MP TaxID=3374101 RepID=UPI003754C3AD
MSLWIGAGVALITPFKNGEIDYASLKRLIEWQIEEGTDALIMAGTTGESATMSKEEKLALFSFTVDLVQGRVPVIAGTGSNCTSDTISLSVEAERIGVDGLLLVTPYYNKPSQRGLYAHYKAVADAVKLPVILYNVPGRTSVDLLPETVVKLAEISNIVGLKEASGEPDRAAVILQEVKENFRVYSGNDNEIYDFMAKGAHGVISVLSNVVPKAVHEMVYDYVEGRAEKSLASQRAYENLTSSLFMETNPVPAKEALNLMGYEAGEFRLPLVGLEEQNKEKLISVLRAYGLMEGGAGR